VIYARQLLAWLEAKWDYHYVSKVDIQARVPHALRDKTKFKLAFDTLIEHGYLLPIDTPICINGQNRGEALKVVYNTL
jgi:hypothetical protein